MKMSDVESVPLDEMWIEVLLAGPEPPELFLSIPDDLEMFDTYYGAGGDGAFSVSLYTLLDEYLRESENRDLDQESAPKIIAVAQWLRGYADRLEQKAHEVMAGRKNG